MASQLATTTSTSTTSTSTSTTTTTTTTPPLTYDWWWWYYVSTEADGQYDAARKVYERALSIDPRRDTIWQLYEEMEKRIGERWSYGRGGGGSSSSSSRRRRCRKASFTKL